MSKVEFPTAAELAAMTPDEFEQYWTAFDKLGIANAEPFKGRFYIGRHDIRDIIALKRAGWKPEFDPMQQIMSWFWRRPIRPGTRDRTGQLFKSTSQAINELRRQETSANHIVRSWNVLVNIGGKMYPGVVPARGPLEAQRLADNLCGVVIGDCPQELKPSEDQSDESSTIHVPDQVQ